MRKIIASLDLGSSSIKLVVGEIQKNKVNILSCVDVESKGIKQGFIVNPESAIGAIKEAFTKTEELLGVPVKKVIVSVPSHNLECFTSSGEININSEDKVITHNDIIKGLQKSIYQKIDENKYELVSLLPTKYILNDDEVVSSPVNMIANKLTVNDVAVIIPKKNTERLIKILEKLDIKIVDICVESLADYYEFKNEETNKSVGAVINIGYSATTVSIFNKGILIGSEVIDVGTNNIDADLAYVFKLENKDAKYLKERLTTLDINLADPSECLTFKNINNEEIKISEYDASAVVISRITEIFKLIKKQINLLTKKKISYIIVSGGISEITHFNRFLNDFFPTFEKNTSVEEIGARNNKFSVCIGIIKYYNSRLKLRNAEFSIFNLDDQVELGANARRINVNENSLLGKIYGYFFDN